MIRVGIIGAAGYTAGELIRLLINHPQVQIVFAQSSTGPSVSIRNACFERAVIRKRTWSFR